MTKDGLSLDVGGEKMILAQEFWETEKRLTLGGKAVETIQLGNTLIVIEI